MKRIPRFDLHMIIAFVVVGLIGGGAAYYIYAYQLADAQTKVQDANAQFEQYTEKMPFLPTRENIKILQDNVNLIKAQLDPLVKDHLQAPGNKLGDIANENTVDWKHRLDGQVAKLNAAAKLHGVRVPPNYYYGFSRYLSQAPSEDSTGVLSKQLLGIEEMATMLIAAPVNQISSIRRTGEEDGASNAGAGFRTNDRGTGDIMPGHSVEVAGGLYTAYPFEIDFDATTDAMRKFVNDLMQSPYIFVIRSVAVQNSQQGSPQIDDLDKIAAKQTSYSVTDSPGAASAAKPTAGPQYLFGGEYIRVQVRIDLIEWHGLPSEAALNANAPGGAPAPNPPPPPANR